MSLLEDIPVALWDPILTLFKTIVGLIVHRGDPEKQRLLMFEAAEKLKAEADRLKFGDG